MPGETNDYTFKTKSFGTLKTQRALKQMQATEVKNIQYMGHHWIRLDFFYRAKQTLEQ